MDPTFISFLNAKHKSIAVSSKSKKVEYHTKVEEINVTILKDIDEAIELAHLLTYANRPSASQLHITIILARDSSLYAITSFINSTTNSSTDPFIPKLPPQPRLLFPPITSSTISISSPFDFLKTSSSFPSTSNIIYNSSTIISSTTPRSSTLPPSQAKLQSMAARYAPLVLP